MATHVTHQNRTSTWTADSANDTWIVADDAQFSMKNEFGFNDSQLDNTTFKVEGDITVVGGGYSAAVLGGDGSSMIISKDSVIDARKAEGALFGTGDDLDVVNNGLVKAGGTGIFTSSGGSIDNNGEIRGSQGINAAMGAGSENVVRNRGLIDVTDLGIEASAFDGKQSTVVNFKGAEIRSDDVGVSFDGFDGVAKLVNKGLIDADTAVEDGNGATTLVNKGKIVGDIDLGAGNDVLNLRRGSIEGSITGGADSDIYRVSKKSIELTEAADGGNDTVLSSSKFTLGDNFETLELVGRKDVAGRGNDLSSIVTGNKGDNKLFGMDGMDFLSGGKGDDVLTGGAMADTFVFSTGFGRDVIADFENNSDKIDLSDWEGIDSYADLVLTHMTIDGDDIVFQNGSDTLRLKDVDMNELDQSDFII
jgi:serralysin